MTTWPVPDPSPTLRLSEIFPISARAQSWIARASTKSGFPQNRQTQIIGATFILSGLDYHHDNFLFRYASLSSYAERFVVPRNAPWRFPTPEESTTLYSLHHEAVAYINRLGQFYAFAKALDLHQYLPRAEELMVFRHKHTAHRSIDAPRAADTPDLQAWHAESFGFAQIWINSFPVFQIPDSNRHIQFHMRDDHPVVMDEAFRVLQSITNVVT